MKKLSRKLTLALAVTLVGCAAETAPVEEGESNEPEPAVTKVEPAAPKVTLKLASGHKCGSWGCDSNHNARRVRIRARG